MIESKRPFHALGPDDACQALGVDPERGLSDEEVSARRLAYGDNSLPSPPRPGVLARLLRQIANPLVGALLVAAFVAFAVALAEPAERGFGRFGDAIAVLLIVLLNAWLGFVQEARAERALDALEALGAPSARVQRGGEVVRIDARELVPGDLVLLESGDAVPADLRLLETHSFAVQEASLTGESVAVEKSAERRLADDAELAERENLAHSGTVVTRGHALGVAIATGTHTELGRIGALIQSGEREATPLEKRISRLGQVILWICLAVSGLVFALDVGLRHTSWALALLTAVSLAVAAIPEGLPAITTITLALGMQRMAKRGALIRRLPAVETLGSATVICTDKTGTLTENRMQVMSVETLDRSFRLDAAAPPPAGAELGRLCATACLCNTARTGAGGADGDPTEVALLKMANDLGVSESDARGTAVRDGILPFDSERQSMTVWMREPSGKRTAHVKGAPEVMLPRCSRSASRGGEQPLSDATRERLMDRAAELADEGLRVLALAQSQRDADDDRDDLVLLGLVAMRDPPRPGVETAIADCHRAGIAVIMITGDHPRTALSIAREIGLAGDADRVLTGRELATLDDDELDRLLDRAPVFARISPDQKLRLVVALSRKGHVVAMTGDGVNDAPALERAAIGVAMGRAGTEVARQAADMVLEDDDFASIVHAVMEGRAIFDNIRKFVFFLNGVNAGLVVAVVATALLELSPPLTPLQLLWINLVTNGLPALALGLDPPERDLMQRPPRPPSQGLFQWRDAAGIALIGTLMGGAALLCMLLPEMPALGRALLTPVSDGEVARTLAFSVLALSPLVHAFNSRTTRASIFSGGRAPNRWLRWAVLSSGAVHATTVLLPPLHPVFKTRFLDAGEWLLLGALAILPLPVVELAKWIDRRIGLRAR